MEIARIGLLFRRAINFWRDLYSEHATKQGKPHSYAHSPRARPLVCVCVCLETWMRYLQQQESWLRSLRWRVCEPRSSNECVGVISIRTKAGWGLNARILAGADLSA